MRVHTPAKLNLTLEILGKRTDGYHDVVSVVQAVGVYDTLDCERLETGHIEFGCDVTGLAGSDNLVVRAAHLLRAEAAAQGTMPVQLGARIRLTKRIPVAAGLGGGSSDAAAALRALDHLWGLKSPTTRLTELAARLGSDVPFFLGHPTALAEGRGERLTPLPSPPPAWAVLVRPRRALSSREVYGGVTPAVYSDGARSRQLASRIATNPDWRRDLYNALEPIACALAPTAAAAKQALRAAGGEGASMTGSGPTVFAVVDREAEARAILGRLGGGAHDAYVAEFVCAAADAFAP